MEVRLVTHPLRPGRAAAARLGVNPAVLSLGMHRAAPPLGFARREKKKIMGGEAKIHRASLLLPRRDTGQTRPEQQATTSCGARPVPVGRWGTEHAPRGAGAAPAPAPASLARSLPREGGAPLGREGRIALLGAIPGGCQNTRGEGGGGIKTPQRKAS